jgi:hypothetical protein
MQSSRPHANRSHRESFISFIYTVAAAGLLEVVLLEEVLPILVELDLDCTSGRFLLSISFVRYSGVVLAAILYVLHKVAYWARDFFVLL